MALLSGLAFPGRNAQKFWSIRLNELPERAEGLRSIDLLVINDTDTSTLTPEQISALIGWVQQGGRLVSEAEPVRCGAAGLPEKLLPLKLQGTVETGREGLEPLADYAESEPIQPTGPSVVALGRGQ